MIISELLVVNPKPYTEARILFCDLAISNGPLGMNIVTIGEFRESCIIPNENPPNMKQILKFMFFIFSLIASAGDILGY